MPTWLVACQVSEREREREREQERERESERERECVCVFVCVSSEKVRAAGRATRFTCVRIHVWKVSVYVYISTNFRGTNVREFSAADNLRGLEQEVMM